MNWLKYKLSLPSRQFYALKTGSAEPKRDAWDESGKTGGKIQSRDSENQSCRQDAVDAVTPYKKQQRNALKILRDGNPISGGTVAERKMEGQVKVFDLVGEIEGWSPALPGVPKGCGKRYNTIEIRT